MKIDLKITEINWLIIHNKGEGVTIHKADRLQKDVIDWSKCYNNCGKEKL